MSASEWRNAAKVYSKAFPDISDQNMNRFDILDTALTKLTEFMFSDDGKAGQELLKVSGMSIALGTATYRHHRDAISDVHRKEYYLDASGLSWRDTKHGRSFEASPLDVVRAFYHKEEKRYIVEYIKEQLDTIANKIIEKATSK